jgi:hypothetical protein
VFAGKPSGFLSVRLSVAIAICAARDGRFDLTNRLIEHATVKLDSGTEIQTRFALYYLIQRLADIPDAGPSAQAAVNKLVALPGPPDRTIQTTELAIVAAFAAGQDLIGVDRLDRIDRRGALSVQVDRRFAPAWLKPEDLATEASRSFRFPGSGLGEPWVRDLALLSRESDEASVLSAARRFIQADADYGFVGDSQRAWLVRRLLEDGRVDEALRILDPDVVFTTEKSSDMLFLPGFIATLEALIRADRTADARRLLDAWTTAQARNTDFATIAREDAQFLWPVWAIDACLKGNHSSPLGPVEWRIALVCGDPESRTADLLIAALSSPISRGDTLQALNLPPRHASLGKADDDYRKRWDALLARPDVAAAIERYGRRLPPEIAWRSARAYPAF